MIAAFLTDNLEQLKYQSDSSILLAEEVQRRGFKVFQFTPQEIFLKNGIPTANGRFLNFTNDEKAYYAVIEKQELCLLDAEVILIRHDPPYNMDYLTPIYMLRLIEEKVKIINKPSALLTNPEKISASIFSDYTPPTLVCPGWEDIIGFQKTFKDIVIKPLYGHGGNGVVKISQAKEFEATKVEHLKIHKNHIIAQQFLPTVTTQGDKRVIICEGEVIGAIKRKPLGGSFITNLAAGGSAETTELTKHETKICHDVGLFLKNSSIFLAGLDLIDEKLIEINITSPTGLKALNKLYDVQIEKLIVTKLLAN